MRSGEGTLRPLDVPRNTRLWSAGRYWGPNADEFLWFVTVDCRVGWIAGRRAAWRCRSRSTTAAVRGTLQQVG